MPFIAPVVGAIVSGIGAIGSFLGGLGVIGKALISIGLNVAMSYIGKLQQKKPQGGVQIEREYGGTVSRRVAIGPAGVAGHDCYLNTYGGSNRFLQHVFELSDYPCDSLSRVALDGEWVTLGEEDPQKGRKVTSGEWANEAWVKFVDGHQTEANAYLVANANPSGRWTEDHIGAGVCYVIFSTTYHHENNNQLPDLFFEFRGARLYDWRKDSTNGGTGSHRWNDPSTHEYSDNPIVADYNYRRGFSVNGDLFCGMGMPASDLPIGKYTIAANLCDEDVSGEHRYRVSILLDAGPDTTHGQNIDSLMLACGGMGVDGVDGSWPIVGSDQPIVATLTDDDLIVGAPVKFRRHRSMGEIVNSISGNYTNPDELWSMVGYQEQKSAAGLVLDRRTRDIAIDFPMVSSKRQAEQLASIYLEENRLERTAQIVVRPRWQFLEPGDWVRWNSARYGNHVYLVQAANLASLESDGPRNTSLSLQERDGSIYEPVTTLPYVPPLAPALPDLINEVDNLIVIVMEETSDEGHKRPVLRASRSDIADQTIAAVQFQWLKKDDATATFTKTAPVDENVVFLQEGVLGGTTYIVQTKPISEPERAFDWSDGYEIAVPVMPYTDVSVGLAQVQNDMRSVLTGVSSRVAEIVAQIEQLAASTAIGTGKQVEQTAAIRRTTNALAAAFLLLEAAITDDENGLSALASAVLGVQAEVGNVSAGGLIQFIAQVPPPAGVYSQINIMHRVDLGDTFKQSGISLQIVDVGGVLQSRFALLVDKAVLSDGTDTSQPMYFEAGVLTLDTIRVRNGIIDTMQTPDGKLRLGILGPGVQGLELWS